MKSFLDHKNSLQSEKEKNRPINEKPDEISWKRWKQLVNLSLSELEDFYISEEGKELGDLSPDSLKMISDGESFDSAKNQWSPEMWKKCRKQASTISRLRSMRKRMVGNPFERDGKMTRWLKSMLSQGHDPRKSLNKI